MTACQTKATPVTPQTIHAVKAEKTFVSKTRAMSVMLRPEKYWSHQGKINDSTVALRNNNSLALIMKPCGGCSLEARAIAWMSMPNQYHQCGNHTRAILLEVISAGQAKAPVATPGQQKQLRLKNGCTKTRAMMVILKPEQQWPRPCKRNGGIVVLLSTCSLTLVRPATTQKVQDGCQNYDTNAKAIAMVQMPRPEQSNVTNARH